MTTVQTRQGEQVVYYSPTETAAEIRKVLAAEFPGTKFSVKTRKYAGGSSVGVYYWDGPAYTAVKRAVDRRQISASRYTSYLGLFHGNLT